jgi:hypothetical protein
VDRVSRGLLVTSWFVGSFDQLALLEPGAGSHKSDEVRCVDGSPSGLSGLDALERHRDPGGPTAWSLGDTAAKVDSIDGSVVRS